MALEAPLRSSTGSIHSSYLPHVVDMSVPSPDSPALNSQYIASVNSSDSHSLRPNSFMRPGSAHIMSPSSDIVGPSPVTSNGTETTEIEDDVAEGTAEQDRQHTVHPSLMMLSTNIPDHLRKSAGEEAISVIHAPQGFQSWTSGEVTTNGFSSGGAAAPSYDNAYDSATGEYPNAPSEALNDPPTKDPPTVNTNVKPVAYGVDAATPQAQNLHDIIGDSSRIRSGSASSLEKIPESHETDADESNIMDDDGDFQALEEESEIKALRSALEECWTLCNTLANLSSIHRERVFNSSGTPNAHEKAWKSCWKLCKRLYQSMDDIADSFNVRTNLDLCRDFCQALFDVRQKPDEIADSILRVSFELNNHLYSAQDSRNLPEAFTERTLDFYITICHRLMKQRSELAEETDSLLRACWALAEMLFSIRQNRRDGKAPDEELLGSAVQACWELCDIFRDGWTQVRPDRGTPRPSQIHFTFAGVTSMDSRSQTGSRASVHSHTKRESLRSMSDVVGSDRPSRKQQTKPAPPVPETPVTEFEDTPVSPESVSPQMLPNIMVLGASVGSGSNAGSERNGTGGRGWSSNASNMSSYSQNTSKTSKTSSTATTATATNEDINITRIKTLIIKAAMNIGFNRDPGADGATALQMFVKSLPTGSFGSLPAHATLLQNYKNLVLTDTAFRSSASLPIRGKRISAIDVAKSVGWMMLRSGQYGFLRELYKLVFGFQLEDAESRKNVSIAV